MLGGVAPGARGEGWVLQSGVRAGLRLLRTFKGITSRLQGEGWVCGVLRTEEYGVHGVLKKLRTLKGVTPGARGERWVWWGTAYMAGY